MTLTNIPGSATALREIDVFCVVHSLSFVVPAAGRIACGHNGHELDDAFPCGWFWEYCCDCATFVHSSIVAERKPKDSCPTCSRRFTRRFICDNCHVITCESDTPAPRKAILLPADSGPVPGCPGCSASNLKTPLSHECIDFGFKFLTIRDACPFCRQAIGRQSEIEAPREAKGAQAVIHCPACNAAVKAHFKFCKKCRAPLTVAPPKTAARHEPRVRQNILPVVDSSSAGGHSQSSRPDPVLESPAVPFDNGSSRKIIAVVATVVIVGVLLVSAAYRTVSSRASTAAKLTNAIARGNLVAPPADSAQYYYNQLKREGASSATLNLYKDQVMPQLTKRPQTLLDDLTRPGGRDGTLPEWEEAQKLLAWATELTPEDKQLAAKAAYAEGRTAYLKNLIDPAMSAYQRAADMDKSWAVPLNSTGSMLNEHKRYSESRTYLREAIRRNSNWALPYNNMGTSYFLEGNLTEAKNYYERASSLAPNWARPHAWLGSIASKQKDYCSAIGEFEQALNFSTPGMSNWDPQKIQRELDFARAHCAPTEGE